MTETKIKGPFGPVYFGQSVKKAANRQNTKQRKAFHQGGCQLEETPNKPSPWEKVAKISDF